MRDKLDLLVDTYREKTSGELHKIKVRWALGSNVMIPVEDFHRLFLINLAKLVGMTDFGCSDFKQINPYVLFGEIHQSNRKIAQHLHHWNNGGFIDPPEIGMEKNNRGKSFRIEQGRHRAIAAFHLGETEIPVRIATEQIGYMQSKISLKPIDN